MTKSDQIILETLKTLKKLIIFTASSLNNDAGFEEVQKLLSQHFAYNLIFDNDLILNNAHLSLIKDKKLVNALGTQSSINKQLNFVQQLSKRYKNKAFLYSDATSGEEVITIVYTAFNSLNTFILSFPINALSPLNIQLLEKTGGKPLKLPPLVETNKLLSEEFVSENVISHHKFDYRAQLPEKYNEILLAFLLQVLALLGAVAVNATANLKKNQTLSQFYQALETHTEQETINKAIEQKATVLKFECALKNSEAENRQLKKITEINKKSVRLERSVNKSIAKDLDHDLQKISQLTTDSLNNFDSMPDQLLENLLRTIKNSTARLLFLKNSHLPTITNKAVNIKHCFEKSLIIFGPDLYDIECPIDILHFDEDAVYPCSEIALIQLFNGILNRLLFSMEQAKDNFIRVSTEKDQDGFKLVFENSSLGIHPPLTEATELSSPFLSVPNWISTKAIAKILNISIEESFILAKGDTITLKFNGLNLKSESLNENVYALS